jgi:hypothetical protein
LWTILYILSHGNEKGKAFRLSTAAAFFLRTFRPESSTFIQLQVDIPVSFFLLCFPCRRG